MLSFVQNNLEIAEPDLLNIHEDTDNDFFFGGNNEDDDEGVPPNHPDSSMTNNGVEIQSPDPAGEPGKVFHLKQDGNP